MWNTDLKPMTDDLRRGNALRRIKMNVGLVTRFFIPSPRKNPWTNVVFPLPKSPVSASTSAPRRFLILNSLFFILFANFSANFWVSAEEELMNFFIVENCKKDYRSTEYSGRGGK